MEAAVQETLDLLVQQLKQVNLTLQEVFTAEQVQEDRFVSFYHARCTKALYGFSNAVQQRDARKLLLSAQDLCDVAYDVQRSSHQAPSFSPVIAALDNYRFQYYLIVPEMMVLVEEGCSDDMFDRLSILLRTAASAA